MRGTEMITAAEWRGLSIPFFVLLLVSGVVLAPAVRGDERDEPTELLKKIDMQARMLRRQREHNAQLQKEIEACKAQRLEERLVQSRTSMREHLRETTGPSLAWSLNDAGLQMASEGELAVAQLLFERSLALLEAEFEPMHPARGTVLQNLGEVLWRRREPQAADCYREAVSVFSASVGEQHPRLASALNAWGSVLSEFERADEAETAYGRAIRIYESSPHANPLDLVVPLCNMGVLLLDLGRVADAGPLLERALIVLKKNDALESQRALVVLRALSRQLRVAGNEKQAKRCDDQSAALALKLVAHAMEMEPDTGR